MMRTTYKQDVNTLALALGGAAAGALLMYLFDPERGGARRAHSAAALRDAGARSTDALAQAWDAGAGRLRRGAHGVVAQVEALLPPTPDEMPAAPARREERGRAAAGGWRPAVRRSALAGGALMAVLGLARRTAPSLLLGLAGAALLARGAANQPLGGMLRARKLALHLDQTVDLETAIHIHAAPEDVYDLWTDYENFPRFMSHVSEVRELGKNRSHWVVKGPGGSEFSWNSLLTEQTRPQRLAWRSEAGAEIPQSGSVQLEPVRGGTRVTVRMSYTPPAGVVGRGLAALLGADPQARLADDLAHMKAYIERGQVPRGGARLHTGGPYLH